MSHKKSLLSGPSEKIFANLCSNGSATPHRPPVAAALTTLITMNGKCQQSSEFWKDVSSPNRVLSSRKALGIPAAKQGSLVVTRHVYLLQAVHQLGERWFYRGDDRRAICQQSQCSKRGGEGGSLSPSTWNRYPVPRPHMPTWGPTTSSAW